MGMVAGVSWVLLALTAIFIRRWCYELFYYLHVSLWIVSLVSLGFHHPDLANKFTIAAVVAGSAWGLDRLIRFVRLMVFSVNNSATLTPLANGGTRVTLAKPLTSARPGKHAFLWIPQLRLCQSHPFTVASADPLEFVIASRDGFTGALHKYAVANPGACVKASIEGPYGAVLDVSAFESVVLIAGGSGASFTFGLAQTLSRQRTSTMTRRVVFVWVVKHNPQLEWFAHHLVTLGNDARFSPQVFVTRDSPPPAPPSSGPESDMMMGKDVEKGTIIRDTAPDKYQTQESHAPISVDVEKSPSSSDSDSNWADDLNRPLDVDGMTIHYQRPDIAGLIREAVRDTAPHERMLVAGCGPAKLLDLMRETTVDCIRSEGPSIELHCETFGW
ncbi:hypothetical protein E4U41_000389 [Claviceps citrina]|nr:hypothetical protein E4U41_000389 [Claviceps citrina]